MYLEHLEMTIKKYEHYVKDLSNPSISAPQDLPEAKEIKMLK